MAPPPTPHKLQNAVIHDLKWMAGPNAPSQVTPKQKLDVAFGLTAYQRKALAAPFEVIARNWKPNANISRSACEQLTTVAAAVALVSQTAGFDGSWYE